MRHVTMHNTTMYSAVQITKKAAAQCWQQASTSVRATICGKPAVVFFSLTLSACVASADDRHDQANQLQQHNMQSHPALASLQPSKPDPKGRYRNLFSSPKHWPVDCLQDCYQPDARVLCVSEGKALPYTNDCTDKVQVRWNAATASAGTAPVMTGSARTASVMTVSAVTAAVTTEPVATAPILSGWQLQWTGHASFRLLSPQGQLLLIDPVSAGFDWPLNWLAALAGHRRDTPDFATLADGKTPAAVLYSHAHYDHFNQDDAVELGEHSPLFMPKGMAQYLPEAGLQLHEMDWYSSTQLGELTLHFVPAHHYTGRGLYEIDGDTSLWGGWVVQLGEQQLYIAGDTGYSPVFQQIASRFGKMDLCLLPIGSYHGEHYRNAHLTPEDALQVAKELGCQQMIPWGYGNYSWQMGDKSSHAPLLRLLSMHRQLNATVGLQVLNEGEVLVF